MNDRNDRRTLNRRQMLGLLAGAGAGLIVGCGDDSDKTATPSGSATPTRAAATATKTPTATAQTAASSTATAAPVACVLTPALTEGPYFVDEMLNRADIRSDPTSGAVKEGVALRLALNVSEVGSDGCTPLAGALVDVWHCDALGVYSDVADPTFDTKGQKFLRGYQLTDENGAVAFQTIYPGWYSGRAVHIHFKVRTSPSAAQGHEFTSQFFFDDGLSDQVFTQAPYNSKGQRDTRNSGDGIYQQSGGQLTLSPAAEGDGYSAQFHIGVQIA